MRFCLYEVAAGGEWPGPKERKRTRTYTAYLSVMPISSSTCMSRSTVRSTGSMMMASLAVACVWCCVCACVFVFIFSGWVAHTYTPLSLAHRHPKHRAIAVRTLGAGEDEGVGPGRLLVERAEDERAARELLAVRCGGGDAMRPGRSDPSVHQSTQPTN